jgi:cytochrome P450
VQGDDDGRIMTDEQLRDEIITILIAGQESVIMI